MFALGIYKSYDELEECLTLDELMVTYKAIFDKEHRHNKFMAALQGADIDKNTPDGQTYGGNENLPDAATAAGGMNDFHNGQMVRIDTGTGRKIVEVSQDDIAARLAALENYGNQN